MAYQPKTSLVHCKICNGSYDSESDLIDAVYTQRRKGDGFHARLLGYFCEFCRPPSAYIHPGQMVYVVDKVPPC